MVTNGAIQYPVTNLLQARQAIQELAQRLAAAEASIIEQQEQLALLSGRYHALIEKRAQRQKPAKA